MREDEISELMKSKKVMLEALSTYLHHDAISGTARQQVANDYKNRMLKAIEKSRKTYKRLIKDTIYAQTGIDFKSDLEVCEGNANETFKQCPISHAEHKDVNSFYVIVHNSANKINSQFVRIRLPGKNWKGEVWNKEALEFQNLDSDVLEQARFNKNYTLETEYEMFVPLVVEPNEVNILKINQEFLAKED